MIKVFVTGASGFLAVNLIEELLKNGFYVKAQLRNKGRYPGPPHDHLELVEAQLHDHLTPYIEGCTYVIHIAAETRQHLTNYTAYQRVNADATRELAQMVQQVGSVRKFIFVSTANTLGHGSRQYPGHENLPARLPFCNSFYAKSKLEAEQYLLTRKWPFEVVMVHPTFMLGAYGNVEGSVKIVLMGRHKKFILYPPGGKNFVHVQDVAKGIIACMLKAKDQEKYLLAHENRSYKEFFTLLSQQLQQRSVLIPIPAFILILAGCFGSLLRRMNIPTSICLTHMRMICQNNFYQNNKSVQQLNMQYQPVERMIEDSLLFFQNKGS